MSRSARLRLVHTPGVSIGISWNDVRLLDYAYAPDDPTWESPKPYLHPLRTLDGELVSAYRPWDHAWHKGIQLAIAHVGTTNFWGGPTYVDGQGYVWLDNNGEQEHLGFDEIADDGSSAHIAQRLRWRAADGTDLLDERRELGVRVVPEDHAWILGFSTALRNRTEHEVVFGSPTTNGRPAAGYGGLFWRGPRDFTGGLPFTSTGDSGDEAMGKRATWAAFTGQHDGTLAYSTVIFVDSPGNPRHPTEWFLRGVQFPGICPAPFYSEEYHLPQGDTLALRYLVAISAGRWDGEAVARFVSRINQ